MTHIDLFAGIGGFSLAARWMDWETVAWCEWDHFCQTILKYHFPHAQGHGDINKTDFSPYTGAIDILTGGFPCQPYSNAGKRKGTSDDRNQWPGMLRAIKQISPRWIVGENVRGITNWAKGVVFDQVQADLEAAGYEVLPFLLPAGCINAPHKRERIWFLAYADGAGRRQQYITPKPKEEKKGIFRDGPECNVKLWDTKWDANQPEFLRFLNGLPNWVDNSSVRYGSITAAGNAIVPQVAFEIFKAIEAYEKAH